MSVTDWFPTLLRAANIDHNIKKIDGVDLWEQIIGKRRMKIRRRIVHVLDTIFGYTSIRDAMWKYVNGTRLNGQNDGWLGAIGNETDDSTDYITVVKNSKVAKVLSEYHQLTSVKLDEIRAKMKIRCPSRTVIACDPLQTPCLFDIETDPCERINVAANYPKIMSYFEGLVAFELWKSVPSARVPIPDPLANPAFHNNTWTWWRDSNSCEI